MPDCLNLVQHLQPKCLEGSFLPLQTRKTSTAESRNVPTFCAHIAPCQKQPTASLEKPSAQSSPSTLRPSLFAHIVSAARHIVTLLAQVDRMSCSSFFCHNGRKLVELEALFSALVVAHVQGRARLTDCTRGGAQLLHLFFVSISSSTWSCVSADSTRYHCSSFLRRRFGLRMTLLFFNFLDMFAHDKLLLHPRMFTISNERQLFPPFPLLS